MSQPDCNFDTNTTRSAILLGVVALSMLTESISRIAHPQPIDYRSSLPVAVLGLAANLLSVYLLHDRSGEGSLTSLSKCSAARKVTTISLPSAQPKAPFPADERYAGARPRTVSERCPHLQHLAPE